MSDYNIILYERLSMIVYRARKAFENTDIIIHEATTEAQISGLLKNLEISAIILDVDSEIEDNGMSLLKRVREKVRKLPVIVMTSNSKKKFYVEAMLEGATDFILKPFENSTLVEKVQQYAGINTFQKIELVTFNLSQYIKGELRKAEKGKYPVSIMFITYTSDNEPGYAQAFNEIGTIEQITFENIRQLFWETDIFIRFGDRYYIGVFPFCSSSNTEVIKAKIEHRFLQLKYENSKLENFALITVFVTFPVDTDDVGQIQDILVKRVLEQLPDPHINNIELFDID